MNAIRTRAATVIRLNRCCHDQSSRPRVAFALGVLLAGLLGVVDPLKALGQGTVNFQQRISGVFVTHVYGPDAPYSYWPKFGNTTVETPPGTQTYAGPLITGSGWQAQLWAAPGADQPESALQPAFPITTFRTGATLGGTVAPVTVTMTNVPADSPVATVQMRVWPAQYSSWGQALAQRMHGDVFGKSPTFKVEAIGGNINPPANLLNFRSFSLIAELLDSPVRPLIYAQPQPRSVAVGGKATFTVEAASPTLLSYSWQFNGSSIASGPYDNYDPTTNVFTFPPPNTAAGIITASRSHDPVFSFPATNLLQLTNVQPAQAGIYSLAVVNLCCSTNFYPIETLTAVSSNAVLTVGNPGQLTVLRDHLPQIVLNWDGVFFLQSATNVGGPFTDLPGPVVFAPYTNTDSSNPRFFRLRN